MGEAQHDEDLRSVREGDSITVETTEGHRFEEVECVEYMSSHAAENSGEVRQSHTWILHVNRQTALIVGILDGLKSSPDDPDFPVHDEVAIDSVAKDMADYQEVGYLETVEIHESMLEQ